MSNEYTDLDKDVEEGFRFKLGGNLYFMRFPTTEELEEIQKIGDELKQTEALFELAKPEDEKAPSLKEALKKKNVKVLQKFRDLLVSQIGAE